MRGGDLHQILGQNRSSPHHLAQGNQGNLPDDIVVEWGLE